jgi:hypothetical protein
MRLKRLYFLINSSWMNKLMIYLKIKSKYCLIYLMIKLSSKLKLFKMILMKLQAKFHYLLIINNYNNLNN